ncbi:MAG: hypothetical protein J6C66_07955 [Prevotella sp.]|nr:hypothetical protein [Prevotella sp.]
MTSWLCNGAIIAMSSHLSSLCHRTSIAMPSHQHHNVIMTASLCHRTSIAM